LPMPLTQKVNGENDAIHCFLCDLRVLCAFAVRFLGSFNFASSNNDNR
jgi:hypothetical protein